jgi:hypothetical protein
VNNTNNSSARDSYNNAREIYFKAWLGNFGGNAKDTMDFVDTLKLSQHELRLEVELNATSNTFQFGVTPDQPNTTNVLFNTENRLIKTDSIVISEYGIFVAAPSSRTAVNYKLRTYGNTQDFGAADGLLLDSIFYTNGALSISAANDLVIPYRGLFNHWYKGQTQETAPIGAASPDDMVRGAEDGMITMEPNILLIGSKQYRPTITLPTALVGLAGTFDRAVLILRGVLAQNSTPGA